MTTTIIKFVEIIPDSGSLGTQVINLDDMPGGLAFSREHQRPISPRRTQSGILITQNIRYNKKTFSLSGTLYEIGIHSYLQDLYESGVQCTLKLYYEDSNYVEQTEFNGSVRLISYTDDMDEIANSRTINAVFLEV